MASISLCMIVRDEEENLPRSLAPIAGYFDEMVVVDTGSSDKTVSLAKQYGAKVFEVPWRKDFSYARNQSIEFASGDWIMWFDADNRMEGRDAQKIRGLIDDQRNKIFWCTEVVEPGGGELIQKRVFPNQPGFRFEGSVHEQLVHTHKRIRYVMTDVKIYHWGYRDRELLRQKGLRNLEILKEELKSRPNDYYFNFNIARCYGNLREFDKAIVHLKKIIQNGLAEQENPDIYFYTFIMIFLFYQKSGKLEEGRQTLDALLKENPQYGLGWFYSGKYHLKTGDFKSASQEFRKFQDLGISVRTIDIPDRKILFESYYWLAQCYERLGDPLSALHAYQKSLDYEPDNSHIYLKMALLSRDLGKKKEGKLYLENCLRIHPEDRKAKAILSQG
jgi:glycosyltransferase involved in cell wall biosynthesis